MKAIILAGLMGMVFLGAMTTMFRLLTIRRPAVFLTRAWLASLVLLVFIYWLLPADLWILPGSLLDDPAWFGPAFCAGLWFAGFFGGLLQLYNLTERGMSLRILIDIVEASPKGKTVDEVLSDYSRGQGIGWMFQKRLDGLIEHQIITLEKGVLSTRERGRRAAILFGSLRRLLRLSSWT